LQRTNQKRLFAGEMSAQKVAISSEKGSVLFQPSEKTNKRILAVNDFFNGAARIFAKRSLAGTFEGLADSWIVSLGM
jgi:hypothetical protein